MKLYKKMIRPVVSDDISTEPLYPEEAEKLLISKYGDRLLALDTIFIEVPEDQLPLKKEKRPLFLEERVSELEERLDKLESSYEQVEGWVRGQW